MNIVQTIVYYIILLLIHIGDGVLILLSLMISLSTMLLRAIGKIARLTLGIFRQVFQRAHSLLSKVLRAMQFRKKKAAKKGKRTVKRNKQLLRFRYFAYGATFSTLFFFLPIIVFLFLEQLPNPKALTERQIPQTTKIYDRNGILLAEIYGPQNRTIVSLNQIPKDLINATIAIEDKNFYTHPGFDIQAIIRALRENLLGRGFQGASTITQQLVRSSLLTNEPTIVRKSKEILIAFWTERLYTKDEILLMYFNQIPYGGTSWGVEAAAQVYFGKHVQDLTLAECAFIAGITAAPTTYSPFSQQPHLWKKRQKEVLSRMEDLGFITHEEMRQALEEPLRFRDQFTSIRAPHFVNYLKDYLAKKYSLAMLERGGLTIVTSLDYTIQEQAEEIVAEEVDKARYLNLTNGAMLVTNPKNGDILAMIGSHDFYDPRGGNVNVTTSKRQPGSAIKVITYAAALMQGFTPATILDDSPVTYTVPGGQPYAPVNYDGRFVGRIPLRDALANSLNVPAVKTLNAIGIETMVNLAKRMGISSWGDPETYGLSVTLGAAETSLLEMATVYGVLANGGYRIDLNPVLKITDYKGVVIEKKKHPHEKKVLPEGVAFILSDILADNKARSMGFGFNSPLSIPGHTVSVKTGTSDNKRDNWAIGFTEDIVVAVWVGNNDNTPMSQRLISGITGAATIWNRMMTILLKKYPEESQQVPKDIVVKQCFGRTEYFLRGTEETVTCEPWVSSRGITPSFHQPPQAERRR